MKTKTTLAAGMLALLAMALPAGAWDGERAALAQEEQAEEQQPYGCRGTSPAEVLRVSGAVAQIVATMRIDGNLQLAGALLDRQWMLASSNQPFNGQLETLTDAALARVELFKLKGNFAQALEAASHLLPRARDVKSWGKHGVSMGPARDRLKALALKAASDPRLVKLREELGASQSNEEGSLERMVKDAYAASDFDLIEQLGAPAQPAFASAIVADADHFPNRIGRDPLKFLLHMNEQRAAEILLKNLNQGGYIWKHRIVRAMDFTQTGVNVLANEGTWSNESPYVCLEPEWLSVLAALLSSPDTALQSVHLIEEPFLRDQLTPELQAALVHGIKTYPLEFVTALLRAIDYKGVVDSARPIYAAAAAHPSAAVRVVAARALANYEESSALRSMAGDPDAAVRALVATSLRHHSGFRIQRYLKGSVWSHRLMERTYTPVLDENANELIRLFCKDSSVAVRTACARVLRDADPPLEDQLYLQMVSDESGDVRATMAYVSTVSPELRGKLLGQLAQDSNPSVLEAVDQVLQQAPLDSDLEPYLEALSSRIRDNSNPFELGDRSSGQIVKSARGLQAYTSWMLASHDPALREKYFLTMHGRGFDHLLGLDDVSLGKVFVLSRELKNNWNTWILIEIRNARPSRADAMRIVFLDEKYDTAVRLAAGELAAPNGGEAFRQGLLRLLASESWKTNAATPEDLVQIDNVVTSLPENELNRTLLDIVHNRAIPEPLAQGSLRRYSPTAPLGREITLAVMDRWFTPEAPEIEAVMRAIEHLAALPADATPELMRAIVLNPHYTKPGIEAMGMLLRDEDLPTLELCLESKWIVDRDLRQSVRNNAAYTVATFLSDQAVEVMVRGLASSESNVRRFCSQGLDSIEKSRERQEHWTNRGLEKPTKESALAELLEMLGSKNLEIRVQAIRGISTFGAIEYLPTLIRLLADPEAKIVEAARDAIDTLSLTESKQQTGENPK